VRVIPVIDVMGGVVVRAVGGRRERYRPLESRLTESTDPVEVARALIEVTGATTLYAADLDVIRDPNAESDLGARLADDLPKTTIWLDRGIRAKADLLKFPFYRRWWLSWLVGIEQRLNLIPVLASETLSGPETALLVGSELGPGLVFSVDLYDGRWLGHWEPWRDWGVEEHSDLIALADAGLSASGATHLIILDLARIGEGRGTGTEQWVRRAKERFEAREIVAGGGIRDWDDVKRLEDAGADAVLVASALHDGTLTFPRPAW
jgi:phosphoribosylformimino-5-aminoimidazole carboxamide ribotide isomerase